MESINLELFFDCLRLIEVSDFWDYANYNFSLKISLKKKNQIFFTFGCFFLLSYFKIFFVGEGFLG